MKIWEQSGSQHSFFYKSGNDWQNALELKLMSLCIKKC